MQGIEVKSSSATIKRFIERWYDLADAKGKADLIPYIDSCVSVDGSEEKERQRAIAAFEWISSIDFTTWKSSLSMSPSESPAESGFYEIWGSTAGCVAAEIPDLRKAAFDLLDGMINR